MAFGRDNGGPPQPPTPPPAPDASMPKPELPTFRQFKVWQVIPNTGEVVEHNVSAHQLDFTTAGGIFFTDISIEWSDEHGWVGVKRYRTGFGTYFRFAEVTPPPTEPSTIIH